MGIARTEISLRPVTNQDEGFLRQVYADSRKEELAQVEWPPGAQEQFLRSQFDAQTFHYSNHYTGAEFLIIECEGQPVGRLYIYRTPSDIRVMDIALLAAWRGRGIGTILLQEILDDGLAAGCLVSIHVEKFNPALRLYQRLGFQIAGDAGAYWLLHRTPAGGEHSVAAAS